MSKPTDEQPRKSPTREGDITAHIVGFARGNPSRDEELEVCEMLVDEQPWARNAMFCCLLAVPAEVAIVLLVPIPDQRVGSRMGSRTPKLVTDNEGPERARRRRSPSFTA